MHALYVTVTIADGSYESAHKALREQIVPKVRTSPGFVKGYWTAAANKHDGASIVVFKTEQDAKNAAQMFQSNPMPAGVTPGTVEVREVVADA